MKCYIWSIPTYGCESWSLSRRDESRLEAMKLWICHRMKNVLLIDKKKEVLEMMGEERKLF